MPAHKLLIGATTDGLIVQPVDREHKPEGRGTSLSYGSGKITTLNGSGGAGSHEGSLVAHGIVGLLDLISAKYLIAVIDRKFVAQLRGKPVFTITDVALIPLSSHIEARKAIDDAAKTHKQGKVAAAGEPDDSDLEEGDTASVNDETHAENAEALEAPTPGLIKRTTTVAKNIVQDRGNYGRFAAKWFSKGGWTANGRKSLGMGEAEDLNAEQVAEAKKSLPRDEKPAGKDVEPDNVSDIQEEKPRPSQQQSSIERLTPRILRSTRFYLSSGSFFFAYSLDLSASLSQDPNRDPMSPIYERFEDNYFWNKHLLHSFFEAGQTALLLPVMQGFVGQREFTIKRTEDGQNDAVVGATDTSKGSDQAQQDKQVEPATRDFLLTIVSRRSVKRAGLRYLRRGIDDEGNVGNYVETEQILSPKDWNTKEKIYSLVQIRGSIPLFFSQSPYSFKPIPTMFGSEETNHKAFKQHFNSLAKRYGQVQVASLVDKHGTEAAVGEAYEKTMQWLNDFGGIDNSRVGFEWFYFHKECGGMKFENVSILLNTLESALRSDGWTVSQDGKVARQQTGILRTNCMDCLDRTNVTQSSVGGWALQQQLAEEGLQIDLQSDPKTFWFNTLWANNGDAISKQYAGTAALKGDFTRTRKRNWTGAISDLSLSLTRYVNNTLGDFFLQTCIDYYLGAAGPGIFDEFETNMMTQDHAMDMRTVRQNAIDTCIKIVLEDPEEDLMGGWTLSCPHEANTLRSLPFEECVLLLTHAALYFCRFDWSTEKVGSFERIILTDVAELWRGAYVTSTLSPTDMDENTNVGFAMRYTTHGKALVRTNTRSLQNEEHVADEDEGVAQDEKEKTSGKSESRLLAFKALPPKVSAAKSGSGLGTTLGEAESVKVICSDVQRAIVKARGMDHLELDKAPQVEEKDVLSAIDARKATGYIESLSHSLKKLVW